jgi:hypothetical protein
VSEISAEQANAVLQSFRRSTLTKEQVFRLWRCAIKDDDTLVDEMIQQIYENILAFDCKRAECVVELIVGRDLEAPCAFRSLLQDLRPVGDARSPLTPSPARLSS